jgi:hypothetical protein
MKLKQSIFSPRKVLEGQVSGFGHLRLKGVQVTNSYGVATERPTIVTLLSRHVDLQPLTKELV